MAQVVPFCGRIYKLQPCVSRILQDSEKNGIKSDNVFDIVGNGSEIYIATNKGVNIINKENKGVGV